MRTVRPMKFRLAAALQAQPLRIAVLRDRTPESIMATKRTIVTGVDLSDSTELILEHALDVLGTGPGCVLHVLTVLKPHRWSTDERKAEIARAAGALYARVGECLDSFPDPERKVHIHARVGEPADELAILATEAGADMIVVGRHGWGKRRRFLTGSTTKKLLDLADCSVVCVQPVDRAVDTREPQCPACAARRAETNGDKWFCADHSNPDGYRPLHGSLRAAIAGGSNFGA